MFTTKNLFSGLTGIAFIVLGIICLCSPVATVLSIAWIIGLLALISGISTLINWISMRSLFTNKASIFISGVIQVAVGIIFMRHDLALEILPWIFACFLIFEGINLSIRSFEYKKSGFRFWYVNLVLGIVSAIFGIISLSTPGIFGVFVGIGFIVLGSIYLVISRAVSSFSNRIDNNFNNNEPDVDEQ